ncbi:hypothetical protein GCM10027456_07480 [Kineosporia babensis]
MPWADAASSGHLLVDAVSGRCSPASHIVAVLARVPDNSTEDEVVLRSDVLARVSPLRLPRFFSLGYASAQAAQARPNLACCEPIRFTTARLSLLLIDRIALQAAVSRPSRADPG